MFHIKVDKKIQESIDFLLWFPVCFLQNLATSLCWATVLISALREDKMNLYKCSSGIIQWYPYLQCSGQEIKCKTRFLPEASSLTHRQGSFPGSCLWITWVVPPQASLRVRWGARPEVTELNQLTVGPKFQFLG